LKFSLKPQFFSVHHDFHWFWKPNFIPFMLKSQSRKFWKGQSRESQILERSDILLLTLQPWFIRLKNWSFFQTIDRIFLAHALDLTPLINSYTCTKIQLILLCQILMDYIASDLFNID